MVRKGNFLRLKKGKKTGEEVKSNDKGVEGDDVKADATNMPVEPTAKVEDQKLKVGKVPVKKASEDDSVDPNFAGLIFMCNTSTKQDCFKYRVFGLPEAKKHLVEQVRRGMRLFLFDVDLRLLYGVYRAVSRGGFNFEADAFRGSGKAFPWQVRFGIYNDCLPLAEDVFKKAIAENYEGKTKFKIELNREQVQKLLKLFRPVPRDVGVGRDLPHREGPSSHVGVGRDLPHREAPSSHVGVGRDLPHREAPSSHVGFGRDLPYREPPSSHHEGRPRANYETNFQGLDRYPQGKMDNNVHSDVVGADDLHPAREARLWRETPLINQVDTNLGALGYGHTSTPLSLYNTDALRSELELGRSDPYKLGARDDLFSAFPQGHSLGNASVEADPLYRQRLQQVPGGSIEPLDRRAYGLQQVPGASIEPLDRRVYGLQQVPGASIEPLDRRVYGLQQVPGASIEPLDRRIYGLQQVPGASIEPLDRRVYGLNPVLEGSSSYTGISSDILQRRPSGLDDRDVLLPPKRQLREEDLLPGNYEYRSRLPYEDGGVVSSHSLLSGVTSNYSRFDARSYNQYF